MRQIGNSILSFCSAILPASNNLPQAAALRQSTGAKLLLLLPDGKVQGESTVNKSGCCWEEDSNGRSADFVSAHARGGGGVRAGKAASRSTRSDSVDSGAHRTALGTRECVRTAAPVRDANQGTGQTARTDAQFPGSAPTGSESVRPPASSGSGARSTY